jgi:hypothetical protein
VAAVAVQAPGASDRASTNVRLCASASITSWPLPSASSKGAPGVMGSGGKRGSVARQVAPGGTATAPPAPYSGAATSGTSSVNWYSSTGPDAAVMTPAAPTAALGASVRLREPSASVAPAAPPASSTGA